MSKKLRDLQSRKAKLIQDARAITNQADAEGRDLTEDEASRFDALTTEAGKVGASIDRESALIAEEARLGIQAVVGNVASHDRREDDDSRGFRSFGEFIQSVHGAAVNQRNMDQRLMIGAAAPGTVGNEAVGTDGGFFIPPQFSREIWALSLTDTALLPYCDNTPISANSMAFPKDETTPWGTDGVRMYWQAEATAANATKPKVGAEMMRLHKLIGLVPLTDELLNDSVAGGDYVNKRFARSLRWKANEAILWGTGAGQPLGVNKSNALITVAKDSGQATGTLTPTNVSNMIARLPEGSYGNAFWLINNDVLPALDNLTLGNYPIYQPLGGGEGAARVSPYGLLKGRPVFVTQHANTFSSAGDVQLHDLSYYRTITSTAGVQTDTSMHLYFDADATAFRMVFRIDGQPVLSQAISPARGTNKLSPFVALGAR